MLAFTSTIDVSSSVSRPLPEKEILWPSVTYPREDGLGPDSTKFPGLVAIKVRLRAAPASPLDAFSVAVASAQERVWLMDPHVLDPADQVRIDQILAWFPERFAASSVRILTASRGRDSSEECELARQKLLEWATLINAFREERAKKLQLEVKFTLNTHFPYVHDRFAIIDNELWHFGATVGGFHAAVNAASRGWDADRHGASQFFNQAWDGDPDLVGDS